MIAKPLKVKALDNYTIWLKYNDGTEGEVNLSHLAGKGIFKQWDKNNFFSKAYIDKQSQSISWNDDMQFCPNTLYLRLKKISYAKWHTKPGRTFRKLGIAS